MRESAAKGLAQGVGYNTVIAWGRFRMATGAQPVLVHGMGVTMARQSAGNFRFTIDGGVKPPIWSAVVQASGSEQPQISAIDEANGRVDVTATDTLNNVLVTIIVVGGGP